MDRINITIFFVIYGSYELGCFSLANIFSLVLFNTLTYLAQSLIMKK
jgi:hypothetical protein